MYAVMRAVKVLTIIVISSSSTSLSAWFELNLLLL